MIKHKAIREGDEFACPCGLRWGVSETDPHTAEEIRGEFHDEELHGEVVPLDVLEAIKGALK